MSSVASQFKQTPVGGYVTVISTINPTNIYQSPIVKSNSGGAATVASPVAYAWTGVPSATNISTLLTAGHVVKDMGSVTMSSSRVFRKFKAIGQSGGTPPGGDVNTSDNDFGTFYLEVASPDQDVPAANVSVLARSM